MNRTLSSRDRGPDLVVVPDVISLARPLGRHAPDLPAGLLGTVGGEPDDREDVGAQVHLRLRIEVAAIACLGDQDGEPEGQLPPSPQVTDTDST